MYVHLTDRVSLGVTGHYIVNRIGRVDATAYTTVDFFDALNTFSFQFGF